MSTTQLNVVKQKSTPVVAGYRQGRVVNGEVYTSPAIAFRCMMEADEHGITPLIVKDRKGEVIFDGDVIF